MSTTMSLALATINDQRVIATRITGPVHDVLIDQTYVVCRTCRAWHLSPNDSAALAWGQAHAARQDLS